jgi:(2Fe-2S) ferredoxin
MNKPKFIDNRDQLEKLAPVMKAPIRRHVFVCNGKSCSAVGSSEVKSEFERILEEKGLRQGKKSKGRNPMGEIDCGSVGFCSIGVAVLVYPEGVWYGQVTAADVPEIIEQHLEKGQVVERLALIELDT